MTITERLFAWKVVGPVLLTLVVTTIVALWNREQVATWCKSFADVATVLGLLVSVIGFVLTILTMLDTQQETVELQAAAERLLEIQRFIENNRMQGQPGGLDKSRIGYLDDVIRLLEAIEGRLLHQAMG